MKKSDELQKRDRDIINKTLHLVVYGSFSLFVFLFYGVSTYGETESTTISKSQNTLEQQFTELAMRTTPEGRQNTATLIQSLTPVGKKRFQPIFLKLTLDELDKFGSCLNRASENDVKQLADRINSAESSDLGPRWWEIGTSEPQKSTSCFDEKVYQSCASASGMMPANIRESFLKGCRKGATKTNCEN